MLDVPLITVNTVATPLNEVAGMAFVTTLNKIREHSPCTGGWRKLLTYLGKTEADDEPLTLLTVLESNGLDDALWCTRAVEGHDRDLRLYAVWAARQVQHLMTDQRSLDALDVAEAYARGNATEAELEAARAAAWAAARAAGAAREAAGAAAREAREAREAAGEAREAQTERLRKMFEDGGFDL